MIVPGNRIDKIHESYLEDDEDGIQEADNEKDEANTSEDGVDAGVITDQSLSFDLNMITRDLQSYYSRIHSEIA